MEGMDPTDRSHRQWGTNADPTGQHVAVAPHHRAAPVGVLNPSAWVAKPAVVRKAQAPGNTRNPGVSRSHSNTSLHQHSKQAWAGCGPKLWTSKGARADGPHGWPCFGSNGPLHQACSLARWARQGRAPGGALRGCGRARAAWGQAPQVAMDNVGHCRSADPGPHPTCWPSARHGSLPDGCRWRLEEVQAPISCTVTQPIAV